MSSAARCRSKDILYARRSKTDLVAQSSFCVGGKGRVEVINGGVQVVGFEGGAPAVSCENCDWWNPNS